MKEMKTNKNRILVGIFSYNEGLNLINTYNQISSQAKSLDKEIVILDESDNRFSLNIVNSLKDQGIVNLCQNKSRIGKVKSYNLLFEYFLKNDFNTLLHFDADHILSNNAIERLVNVVSSNANLATLLNLPLKPTNFFERCLYVMSLPSIESIKAGKKNYPLVGHNGAYDRLAVESIGEIPLGGVSEELYVLYRSMKCKLNFEIVNDAFSYYQLPSKLSDYLSSIRRNFGKDKSFSSWMQQNQVNDISYSLISGQIYNIPDLFTIIRSVSTDLFTSFYLPYILLIRWIVIRSLTDSNSDIWEPIQSTKNLVIKP